MYIISAIFILGNGITILISFLLIELKTKEIYNNYISFHVYKISEKSKTILEKSCDNTITHVHVMLRSISGVKISTGPAATGYLDLLQVS